MLFSISISTMDPKVFDEDAKRLIRSRAYRLARRLMIALRKLCLCPLVSAERRQSALCNSKAAKLGGREYQEAALEDGPWSNGILCFYIFSSVHILLCVYHQYKLDWSTIRLEYLSFRRELSTNDSAHNSPYSKSKTSRPILESHLEELNSTIQQEIEWMDLLGQPLGRKMLFYGAGFYVGLLTWTLVAYVFTTVNFRYFIPFDQYILRVLIDYELEIELCNQLADEQVEEFLASHRNSIKTIEIDQTIHSNKREQCYAIEQTLKFQRRDKFIEDELSALKARNELLPINRQVAWVRGWLKLHVSATLVACIGALGISSLMLALLYFLPVVRPDETRPWLNYKPADWLVVLETYVLLIILALSIIMHTTTMTYSTIDQFRYAGHLRDLYDHFLDKSKRLCSPKVYRSIHQAAREELNCDLLALIMKFRIFTKQLGSQRKIIGSHALNLVGRIFLLPIMSRIHAPYFDGGPTLDGVLVFLGVVSVLNLTAVSLGLLAPCEMFSQCIGLHKSRIRLMAHLVHMSVYFDKNFFNQHLVMTLRRELNASHELSRQFAITCAGVHFTYATVIRLYFWFGAVILSSMMMPNGRILGRKHTGNQTGVGAGTQSRRHYPDVAKNFLDDPFRILDW